MKKWKLALITGVGAVLFLFLVYPLLPSEVRFKVLFFVFILVVALIAWHMKRLDNTIYIRHG